MAGQHEHVALPEQRRGALGGLCAHEAHPPRFQAGERCLDLAPRRAVADHDEVPVERGELRQGGGQQAVRGELVAAAHHRDGDEPNVRAAPCHRLAGRDRRAGECGEIEEGREHVVAPRDAAHRTHPFDVGRIQAQRGGGRAHAGDRRRVSERPGTVLLRRGDRGFGHHIGNPQGAAHRGTDPVRGLVVEVIREPHVRPAGLAPIPVDEPCCQPGAERRDPRLPGAVSMGVEAAEARCHRGLVPARPQREEQCPRELPVARRHRVIRRFQRRIERHLHGVTTQAAKRPARRSTPAFRENAWVVRA